MHSYFVVNASRKIGTGHWIRCTTIAKALKKKGISSTFYTQSFDENLWKRSKKEDINLLRVTKNETLSKLKKKILEGDLVIIDDDSLEFKTHDFQSQLKTKNAILSYLTIDTKTKFICDYVISYNLLSKELLYNLSEKTRRLTGLEYFIFREEFTPPIKSRKKNFETPSVLVMFGGSDPHDFTSRVIDYCTSRANHFSKVNIVSGALAKDIDPHIHTENIIIHKNLHSVRSLMEQSDVAFVGMGSSFYELALFEIPCWIVASSAREEIIYQRAIKDNYAFGLLDQSKKLDLSLFHSQLDSIKQGSKLKPLNDLNPDGVNKMIEAILAA